MYYVLTCTYAGPNPDQHPDDDVCTIETEPGRTNSSRETRTEGWLGTTNDWSRAAHGEFETKDEALAAVAAMYPQGMRDVYPDMRDSDPETEVARFKPGKLVPWNAADSQSWAYPCRDQIDAATPDQRIDEMVEECRQAAEDVGAALDDDAVTRMLTERRDELKAERSDGDE